MGNEIEKGIRMIEENRAQAPRVVDARYDELLDEIKYGKNMSGKPLTQRDLPLGSLPSLFKGKKPAATLMPDGHTEPTPTWRSVVCAVLADCNADEERHNRLLQLRGKVSGRSRSILSSDPSGMDMPIRIDDGLFFEGKFDTEYLIKMMTERVLDKVGYDYSGIRIAIRNRPTRVLEPEEPKRTEDPSTDGEEIVGPGMRML